MRTMIWIAAILFVGIYVVVAFVTVDRGSDHAQVNALINRGIQATRDRDLTTMVSCISPNYKDDALTYDQLRLVLAQALRNADPYSVDASDVLTHIRGDQAIVSMHVTLKHMGGATFYDRRIKLRLAKEDDRHMLVVPSKTWRVIGSENLGLAMQTPELF